MKENEPVPKPGFRSRIAKIMIIIGIGIVLVSETLEHSHVTRILGLSVVSIACFLTGLANVKSFSGMGAFLLILAGFFLQLPTNFYGLNISAGFAVLFAAGLVCMFVSVLLFLKKNPDSKGD